MLFASFCAAAFLLGAVPTAFLAGKFLRGIDIREHGSGNVGATNAFRVLGKGPGTIVFILDLLKGALPVFLFSYLDVPADPNPLAPLAVGVAAILGHVFTPFLGFKGGKGIATGAGVLLGAYPVLFFTSVSAWILVFLATKIVSISSLVAVFSLVIFSLVFHEPASVSAVFLVMAVFVFWTHRTNIGRLLRGEEKKAVSSKNS